MPNDQAQMLEAIRSSEEGTSGLSMTYWLHYSNMGTWQFWFNTVMLIVPLIVLYFFIDRKKALLIGFYGFNVHVWFTYIDLFGTRNGLWEYPYKPFPWTPVNLALDTSFVPVSFMLVYQWSLNRNMNYYVSLLGAAAVMAGVVKPILSALYLFRMYKWVNYFHLFLSLVIIILISRWITNLFVKFQQSTGTPSGDESTKYSTPLSWRRRSRA